MSRYKWWFAGLDKEKGGWSQIKVHDSFVIYTECTVYAVNVTWIASWCTHFIPLLSCVKERRCTYSCEQWLQCMQTSLSFNLLVSLKSFHVFPQSSHRRSKHTPRQETGTKSESIQQLHNTSWDLYLLDDTRIYILKDIFWRTRHAGDTRICQDIQDRHTSSWHEKTDTRKRLQKDLIRKECQLSFSSQEGRPKLKQHQTTHGAVVCVLFSDLRLAISFLTFHSLSVSL